MSTDDTMFAHTWDLTESPLCLATNCFAMHGMPSAGTDCALPQRSSWGIDGGAERRGHAHKAWLDAHERPSALTQQPRPESFHRVAAKATRDADEVKAGRIRVDLHCTLLRARMSTLEQKHREVASAALACARAIQGEG